jgi:Family of unknown function (DUF5330)
MTTGRVMFFLMRMAFWLGVVCLLLPASGPTSTAPDAQLNAKEAVTLASAAVSDARGFCDRQPTACKVGGKVAIALGHKAEAGARTLYEFITASLSGKSAPTKKTDAQALPAPTPANGTLTAADLQAPWHAPVPLPPRRQARTTRPAA